MIAVGRSELPTWGYAAEKDLAEYPVLRRLQFALARMQGAGREAERLLTLGGERAGACYPHALPSGTLPNRKGAMETCECCCWPQETARLRINPYIEDVCNEVVEQVLCDRCTYELTRDI